MKAQAIIFQFVLFATTAFIIFLAIGNVFSTYSINFQRRMYELRIENFLNYLSSIMTEAVVSANKPKNFYSNFYFSNITFSSELEAFLDKNGIRVTFLPLTKSKISSINNLNYSISEMVGYFSFSQKQGFIKYNRTSNKLELIGVS
ncbi:MAG: hypothetical protein B6U78_02125 [Candidatus Aenigmarchaeota archaeon ex4484_224]|nr:MAG: hypothetical protein B6U78_02125 [Candidatus Aenigmarchaeota archaeon ex4484_224]